MKRNVWMVALAIAAGIGATRSQAQVSTWTIDPAHSSVNFEVVHMGVSHVHGSMMGVNGTVVYDGADLAKSNVDATIDDRTISTGVEQRDTHLKSADFFDVQKNPTITFKSTGLKKQGDKLVLLGDLTLNGVTKPVTLDVDGPAPPQTVQGKTISAFSASGQIERSDFNFGSKFPAAMIGNDVKFTIDVEIDKK